MLRALKRAMRAVNRHLRRSHGLTTLRLTTTLLCASSARALGAAAASAAAPSCLAGNPLLSPAALPAFGEILPEHVEPALAYLLAEAERGLAVIEAKADGGGGEAAAAEWSVVGELEALSDPVAKAWSSVNHLQAVRNSDGLRKAVEAVQVRMAVLVLVVLVAVVLVVLAGGAGGAGAGAGAGGEAGGGAHAAAAELLPQPGVVAFGSRMAQSLPLYATFEQLNRYCRFS